MKNMDGEVLDHSGFSNEELLNELDVSMAEPEHDITNLRHVAPVEDRAIAEEIARRTRCEDFDSFEPMFSSAREELFSGRKQTRRSAKTDDVQVGSMFILRGQIAYVADKEEEFSSGKNLRKNARLRVIFDNGTESNLLMQSLLRALQKDESGRTIVATDSGPLFSGVENPKLETGTIYVLRSKSDLPELKDVKDAILKIGFTTSSVNARIADAKNDPTYLMGEVEIVDEYVLYSVEPRKLEKLLQLVFAGSQVDISIRDRFGKMVEPREWYFLTPDTVAQAVELLREGRLSDFVFDSASLSFRELPPINP